MNEQRTQEIRAEKFWSRVDATGDCWTWESYRNADGYGMFSVGRRAALRAHRYAYTLLVGKIAEGLQLDHLCRNRACVNPDHLQPVTSRENTMRGAAVTARNAQKTHCDSGHILDDENTYMNGGWRRCKECRRAANRRWSARRAAKEGSSRHAA